MSQILRLHWYISNKLYDEYHRLTLWYCISFIAGIISYFSLSAEPKLHHVLSVFIGSISLLYLKKFGIIGRFIAGLVIAFTFGIFAGKYRTTNLEITNIKTPIMSEIEGIVQTIRPTTRGTQLVLKDVTHDGLKQKLSKIRINIAAKYAQEIFINDRIKVTAKLYKPQSNLVPRGYNFGFYAYFSGIAATGYAVSKPEVISDFDRKSKLSIYHVRKIIYDRLIAVLGNSHGNFAAAIILGETKGIDEKLMQNMRRSGISHILCVSGLHLSIVAMIFFISTRFILNIFDITAYRYDIKLIAAFCSLIGSYAYLELSGVQIAATRAFIMNAIFIIAVMTGRTPYPLRSIAIAASFILLINPEYIFHPSFQLSFIAVLSLISGYEFYLKNQWVFGERSGVFGNIKFYLVSNIYSSFLASILTAPVVINQFYIFSTYSIPMNLIAVPIMSFFLMPLAILSIILMPFGGDCISIKLLGFFIEIILDSASIANNMPGSVWYFGYITPTSLIVFLLGFAWLCFWQTSWRGLGIVIIITSFILMLCSPKPEMIIDNKKNIIGIKNKQNKLEIYANQISDFHQKYWANWFGQANAEIYPLNTNNFYTSTGKKININYQNTECSIADIQINMHPRKNCISNSLTINHELLKKVGVIAIFCDSKKCWMQYDNPRKFK